MSPGADRGGDRLPFDSLSAAWRECVSFNDRWFAGWRERPTVFWGCALAGEVGEFCNDAKKADGGGTSGKRPTTEAMLEELADSFIYLALTAEALGAGPLEFALAVGRKQRTNVERMEARAQAAAEARP